MIIYLKMFVSLCIRVILIGIASGCLFAMLPKFIVKRLEIGCFSYESDGLIYERLFRINKWKKLLPQFSNIMSIGFKKDSLRSLSNDYLNIFFIETIRAEITHIFLMLLSPVYLLGEYAVGMKVFVAAANFICNIPFIMVQRYNRPRIKSLIQKINLKNFSEDFQGN